MLDVNNFERIKISLASPEQIRSWSSGEVKKPETINYRTLRPEKEGLFCEKIFGPVKDWECHCGKYKRVRHKGIVCDRCGVEVTTSKVRRERMGHIELAAPVCHIWYLKGIPSRIGLLLDISPKVLEKVIYFVNYIVIDSGDTPLLKKQLLTEKEYRESKEKYGDAFKAGIGAEAVKILLQEINLEQLSAELKEEIANSTGQRKARAIKRLEVVESFRLSGNKPEWMILDVLPVIPPELRPMVQLDGGRFATSDLNDLYRRVINRNNRLKRLIDLGAPDIIVRNEKRMLQEAVDALIDNGRRGRPVTGPGNRPLKSLSDMLKGKQGRFRQNLLGKRVDYSGRSVIVVGPKLKMHQCGLPKEMALELFKPFVMKKLVDRGLASNIKSAKKMVERGRDEVWDILEDVIKEHPVLLNRAPTLHRLGIQAFEPILVEGRALQLHPLVCTAYNADFDGDQMAVHVPLSAEAQTEARLLMLASNNVLNPKDGKPVVTPTQDMVIGIYYLTYMSKEDWANENPRAFSSPEEAIMAYNSGVVRLHEKIKVRLRLPVKTGIDFLKDPDPVYQEKIIETSVGRVILNEIIPDSLGYYNEVIDKKKLGNIVYDCYRLEGNAITAQMLDGLKELGYKFSTRAGISVGLVDFKTPEEKARIIAEADKEVDSIQDDYMRGLINDEERHEQIVKIWNEATDKVTEALKNSLPEDNPVFMMAISGARGNMQQIRQLAGMRGLMADPSGKIIDLPIKANFREGLTVLEYFISTHGARKGLADTALRTADSGYLTRRLVDVSQDVIVREEDCGTLEGIWVEKIMEGSQLIEPLHQRIIGRVSVDTIVHPETGEVLVKENTMIDDETGYAIEKAGIERVKIRSVLTCKTKHGVCQKCYGRNLATGYEVEIGEAVGTLAAQSIGEPGTQLTMRTFHTGGIAGEDITRGLPRVEELFEVRKPKGQAVVAEVSGRVHFVENKGKREVEIIGDNGEVLASYPIHYGSKLKVGEGDYVEIGDALTEGPLNPHDILNTKGLQAVQRYLLQEVQKVYRSQGVDINDKHIEIMIRQMLKKVRVEDAGDTNLLPGSFVDIATFEEENLKAIKAGKLPAVCKPVLLGITKASLNTESFLSAASFQETTKVLTEAAIKGKVDKLIGLKENVIIGKLIPAGTGYPIYKKVNIYKKEETEAEEQ
ncbi:DNA-directed RNA polymerase subunit beta' [Thermosyntropha sp.]|uniref:DNA-directed RNA polymerase subunit beta' n=1 Tax=Thermosyntropha sp. TaxID=2740820 RepID=UPI0025E83BF0|nr:DNA-directed RNA polymerase subunit beta' [Thermosyntropha sp.]MBO8158032.1 DNA-directed RNA polymerase subunit beta' [Thermosyntropha sp.]